MITCTQCKQVKEAAAFRRCRRRKSGLSTICRVCARGNHQAWMNKNRDRYNHQVRIWHAGHPGYITRKTKEHAARVKSLVYAAYGNQCACCGETIQVFLSVDHIYNDGKYDVYPNGTRFLGAGLYARIIKEGHPKDRYQLLCMNCNIGKARNNGLCPHKFSDKESKHV